LTITISYFSFIAYSARHVPEYLTMESERKRKWDEPQGGISPSTQQSNNDRAAEAAAAAAAIAAKIAASLRPGVAGNELVKRDMEEGFVKDIEVNDLRNRYVLTKGATQKQVGRSGLHRDVDS
jgi:hypothetical protein